MVRCWVLCTPLFPAPARQDSTAHATQPRVRFTAPLTSARAHGRLTTRQLSLITCPAS